MQDNLYSTGNKKAELSQEQIEASWGRGSGCGDRILLINDAFHLFYHYRNAIEPLARANWDIYWSMLKQLEEAADSGWGTGVNDLDDAFLHLIRNDGRWNDENTKPYWGLRPPSVIRRQVLRAPAAAANFLTAVNSKLEKLGALLSDYRRIARTPGEADKKIEDLREIAQQATAFCWILPLESGPGVWYDALIEALEAMNKAIEVLEALDIEFRRSIKVVSKVTDWLTRADQAAQTFIAVREAGMPPRLAGAWAALGFAVSYVPVLGDFYAEIVNQTPGLVGRVRTIAQDRNRRLGRAAAGVNY